MDSTRRPNRLARERSPYLLQHSHNPVDWWPWCDEAFALARDSQRPVFLSIGYSSCHWCHVMERESFENDTIAELLSAKFVSIKVDREERPDVDNIYQLAHQILSQRSGGWPLSVFLTPDKQPFFAGTYFPPTRRQGMPSFGEVLLAIDDAWTQRRSEIDEQAGELTRVLGRVTEVASHAVASLSPNLLPRSVSNILGRADPVRGGFGTAPKFPNPMALELLSIAATTRRDDGARVHFARSLDRMARGGIYDHLGGGFARYSTDAEWLVPHFEKMLYDNALLVRAYVEGWRLAHEDPAFAISAARCERVVRETLGYVARQMTSASGAFYSAEDADSEGEEGRFYAWSAAEIETVVGRDDARVACAYFDVSDAGNFEHGRSVLSTPRDGSSVAATLGLSEADLEAALSRATPELFAVRERRPRPFLDDKCLASWNALMISALADAGATLDDEALMRPARRALETWSTLAVRDGRLAHAIKLGEPYGTAYLDDVAGLACAALDVFEATFDPEVLRIARARVDEVLERYWSEADAAFYYTASDAEVVLQRSRDPHDHAYPGGTGLALDALLRLASVTGDPRPRAVAERVMRGLANAAAQNPMGLATVVRAADRVANGGGALILVGDPARDETRAMLRIARRTAWPYRTLLFDATGEGPLARATDPTLWEGRRPGEGGSPIAFVCRGNVCDAPARDADELRRAIVRARPTG